MNTVPFELTLDWRLVKWIKINALASKISIREHMILDFRYVRKRETSTISPLLLELTSEIYNFSLPNCRINCHVTSNDKKKKKKIVSVDFWAMLMLQISRISTFPLHSHYKNQIAFYFIILVLTINLLNSPLPWEAMREIGVLLKN